MNTRYTISNTEVLSLFYNREFMDNEVGNHSEIEVVDVKSSPIFSRKVELKKDEKGLYFDWQSRESGKDYRIYLNEYDYVPYDEMRERISCAIADRDWQSKNGYILDDDVWATLTRTPIEKIFIEDTCSLFETLIPTMGIGLTGDKEVNVLCVPNLDRSAKSNWDYRISLMAENEDYRGVVAGQSYYFTDFVGNLIRGNVVLTTKEEYAEKVKQAQAEMEKYNKSIKGRFNNLFKKKVPIRVAVFAP